MLRRVVTGLLGLLVLFVTITWVALESSGVITVTTLSVNGDKRQTHVWYVKEGNRLALEAGHPDNPWVKDLSNQTTIAVAGESLDGRYTYTTDLSPEGHREIRNLMRQKYGWRDWWVDLLFDTSQSGLLELHPTDTYD